MSLGNNEQYEDAKLIHNFKSNQQPRVYWVGGKEEGGCLTKIILEFI